MTIEDKITVVCSWLGDNTPRANEARKFFDELIEENAQLGIELESKSQKSEISFVNDQKELLIKYQNWCLRKEFEDLTLESPFNSQGEPEIDYTVWLEEQLIKARKDLKNGDTARVSKSTIKHKIQQGMADCGWSVLSSFQENESWETAILHLVKYLNKKGIDIGK